MPALLGFLEVDDAAEVGALLAERDDLGVGQADEDRRVIVPRVAEQVGVADVDSGEIDDRTWLAGVDTAQLGPDRDTDVGSSHGARTEDEVAGELAAGDFFFGLCLVGKVPFPWGGDGDRFDVTVHEGASMSSPKGSSSHVLVTPASTSKGPASASSITV